MRKILSILSFVTLLILLVACGGRTFTITFESNNGTAVDPLEVTDGEIPSMPADPTRDGYMFDGWYVDEDLLEAFNETGVISEDITVYAKWTSILEAARTALDLGNLTGLTNTSPRLILPTSLSGFSGVTISWSISDVDVISSAGVIMQPSYEDGDATVTLTATLTLGANQLTKAFTATVTALPNPADTEALIDEDWNDYSDGTLIETGFWGPVSGKSGSSLFTVVSDSALNIPGSSKALKIEAFTERQVEGAMPHTYDVVVIEADLMQTASSGGSAINIQTSSGSPVIGFGLQGASLFYRTDNGTQYTTDINVNQWYRIRLEADLINKTIQVFYYLENGQLSQITPGKVTYTGATSLQSVFIRSGSSTTTALQAPAYITNIVANRIEALPRPAEIVALGEVSDVPATVNVEAGTSFTPSVPVIYNAFGDLRALVLNTDYTLNITNPVDINTPDDYTVVYTFTNATNASDVKVVHQVVTVYSTAQPNVIDSVSNTFALYPNLITDFTVVTQQPTGELYVYLSNHETETAETIKSATPVTITEASTVMTNVDASMYDYVHVIVVHNGDSNIVSQLIDKQELVEIDSAQSFFNAVHLSVNNQAGKYFMLTADLDFTSFVWTDEISDWRSILDGNGHVISHLTVSPTARGGIFDEIENGSIINLVMDNVVVNNLTTSTSALLVGEVYGNVLIQNIVVMNSTMDGHGDYAALLVGRVRSGATLVMENIAVADSMITNHLDYTGGLIAGQDTGTSITVSDVYLNGFTVYENSEDTGQMAGAIIGRGQSTLIISHVVAFDLQVDGIKNVGGLVGKIDTADTVNEFTNIFLEGEITTIGSTQAGSLVGNVESEPTVLNAWTIGFANAGVGLSVAVEFQTDLSTVQSLTWWETNMADLFGSDLWSDLGDGSLALVNYTDMLKPLIDVTIVYNDVLVPNEVIQVRQDDVFNYTPDVPAGLQFVGWYTDAGLTTALIEPYTVTMPVTLYGKVESVPASTVAFDLGDAVAMVEDQTINYGELATEPIIADEMIGGVMKEITGWTLNGEPFTFDTPITESITLVAVWETKVYTVTFDTGDSSTTEADQMVAYNALATEPLVDPVHTYATNFSFVEWQVEGVLYDFNTPITGDVTIVAIYQQDSAIDISTEQAFFDMAVHETSYEYVLTADLDFTGFTWTATGDSFKGVLDGQNHTIANITMDTGSSYGGIFSRANGATISNLVIENLDVTAAGRGGGLIGRTENGEVTITNVVMNHVSVTGNDSNGVAAFIGLVSVDTSVSGIAIINATVHNVNKNVAVLAGRVDKAELMAVNIFIYNALVSSDSTASSDVGAAALVGYVRDDAASHFDIDHAVVLETTIDGNAAGALVGYNRYPGTTFATNLYLQVEFVDSPRSGLIGYERDQVAILDQSTIFGLFMGATTHSQVLDLAHGVIPDDAGWWATNLVAFDSGSTWVNYGRYKALATAESYLPPMYEVTVVFSVVEKSNEVLFVEAGTTAGDYPAPIIVGYEFDALYIEDTFTTAYADTFEVVSDMTVYAKYDAVANHTVTFDISPGVNAAPTPDSVSHYDVTSAPVVADENIGGLMKEVTGWTLNGNPYDFDTMVTEDITLVAVWETKQYTVSFDVGGGLVAEPSQMILYNELATEPAIDPTHIFSEMVFSEWQLSGVLFDFNTPITDDITLVAVYLDPVGNISIDSVDEFYYMANLDDTTYDYVLSVDLDFAGFTWESSNNTFSGTLNGVNHTISNLAIDTDDKGGIFAYINGVTIQNLRFSNVSLTSVGGDGVGFLAGVSDGGNVIQNIAFDQVSVSSTAKNYVSIVVGRITSGSLVMSNIAITDGSVNNTFGYTGGIIGGATGGTLTISDLYVDGLNVTESDTANDKMVGGIVGRVQQNIVLERIVMLNVQVSGGVYVGGLIGRVDSDSANASLTDVFISGEVVVPTDYVYAGSLIGRGGSNAAYTNVTETNAWDHGFATVGASGLSAAHTVALLATVQDQAWWTTNIPNITGSLWTFDANNVRILSYIQPI